MSKLRDIADEKVVVIKHWHGEGRDWQDEEETAGYWFTFEPTQGELEKLGISAVYISWMSGRVLRHAKNGKSVRIKGDSFGLGHWVSVNAEAFEVGNESDDWGSIDHNGFWSGLCPSCRCIVPVGRNRVKSHFLKNGTFCPGSRSEPLMRMEEEEVEISQTIKNELPPPNMKIVAARNILVDLGWGGKAIEAALNPSPKQARERGMIPIAEVNPEQHAAIQTLHREGWGSHDISEAIPVSEIDITRVLVRREIRKQTIRLKSPDGSEDVIEIDKDLYDRFAARAKELGVPENELFIAAMDAFLKKEGY